MDGLEQDSILIRDLVEYARLTPAEVAKKAKIAPSTLHRPFKGTATTRLSQTTIEKLKVAYPDFHGWDDRPAVGEQRLGYRGPEAASSPDTVPVQMLDFAYGMGGTYLDEALLNASTEHFPKAFLRNFTTAPAEQLYFARGIGDSMMPTIHDSDLVLIDRSQDTPRMNDQVWAVARGEIGMIKRLRFTGPNGSEVVIMSDNKDISDDTASDGDLSIIGRVVAVLKAI